jgi:prepilin-type N-terminal cleavage/methylation domain-containing protein
MELAGCFWGLKLGNRQMSLKIRSGFTLVELLVVITIIGILAALITVAANAALKRAHEAQIKVEIDQLDAAFEQVKNKTAAYPPNCQNDGTAPLPAPIDEPTVASDLSHYMKQAFPRSRESDDLLRAIVEYPSPGNIADYPLVLSGGLSASEAVVFWLGGFSSDPKFPVSGDGGPSYPIKQFGLKENRTLDPIDSRSWTIPLDVSRLGPRAADGYFDETARRFIEYRDPKGNLRRINFWQYRAPKSSQPYLYFDTSRHPAAVVDNTGKIVAPYDPPAATIRTGPSLLNVYAFKKRSSTTGSGSPIDFANAGKFQIIHSGIDDAWGESDFQRMSVCGVAVPTDATSYLLFPNGPFTGDIADTLTNFSTSRVANAQP